MGSGVRDTKPIRLGEAIGDVVNLVAGSSCAGHQKADGPSS